MSRPLSSSKGSITKEGCDKLRKAINALSEPKNHGAKAIEEYIEGKSSSNRRISASSIENIWKGKSVDKNTALTLIEELNINDFELDKYWVYDNAPEEMEEKKEVSPGSSELEIPNNLPLSGAVQFVAQTSQLQRLEEKLESQSDKACLVSLSGMGGVGKTELALQYARTHKDFYSGGICWITARNLDAHNNADILTQITSFVQGKLAILIPSQLVTDEERLDFSIQHWTPGNVLLIFDDIDGYSDIKFFVSRFTSPRFKIIVTTRVRNINALFETIDVNVLSPNDSLELLQSVVSAGRVTNEVETARELCDFLGHLPLALEMVGRYIDQHPTLSVATVLDELKRRQETQTVPQYRALMGSSQDANWVLTAPRGLAAAFDLTWDKLVIPDEQNTLREQPQKIALYLGRFTLAPIPWNVIEEMIQIQEETTDLIPSPEILRESKNKLISYNLMKLDDEERETYRIHSLIREYFRSKLSNEVSRANEIDQLILTAIDKVLPAMSAYSTLSEVNEFSVYEPHLLGIALSIITYLPTTKIPHIFLCLSAYHERIGNYVKAAIVCEEAANVLLENNQKDPDGFVEISLRMAKLYIHQERYLEAEIIVNTCTLSQRNRKWTCPRKVDKSFS